MLVMIVQTIASLVNYWGELRHCDVDWPAVCQVMDLVSFFLPLKAQHFCSYNLSSSDLSKTGCSPVPVFQKITKKKIELNENIHKKHAFLSYHHHYY